MKRLINFLILICFLFIFSGCFGLKSEEKTIITVGLTQDPSVAFFSLFSSHQPNNDVYNLTFGYETVSFQKETMQYQIDYQVVSKFNAITNIDGSKTYIITLHNDLFWNDGEKITAKDYVFSLLLKLNPLLAEIYAYNIITNGEILGSIDYADGTKNLSGLSELSGVDLLNEYQFSITINTEFFPNYDEYIFYKVLPLPKHILAPNAEVVQGISGAKLSGITKDELIETLEGINEKPGYRFNINVTCGAYSLLSFDQNKWEIILKANPYYKGKHFSEKPKIDEIHLIQSLNTDQQIEQLKNGVIDLIPRIYRQDDIDKAILELNQNDFKYYEYDGNGYNMLSFYCDEPSGPTSSVNVRQALAYIIDRHDVMNFFGKSGRIPYGQYGESQWMYKKSNELDNFIKGRDKNGNLHDLNKYLYNEEEANRLLNEDGWIWSDLEATVLYDNTNSNHTKRYKKLDSGEIVLLEITWLNTISDLPQAMMKDYIIEKAQKIGISIIMFEYPPFIYLPPTETTDGYLIPEKDEFGNWQIPEYQKLDNNGVIIEQDKRPYQMIFINYSFLLSKFQPYKEVSIENWGYDGGGNYYYLYDEELLQYAIKMKEAIKQEDYFYAWQQYQLRNNFLLPSIPLFETYSYCIHTRKFYIDPIINLETGWTEAILSAKMT